MSPDGRDRDRQRLITDTVIRHLALDEADLRARVAELEGDLHIYREIATEAIHALAAVTRDRNRQGDERLGVITENRHLREHLTRLQTDAADTESAQTLVATWPGRSGPAPRDGDEA